MIIILGLILLVVAAVVAIAGIFGNTGSAHALTNAFSVFGHHMTGSTGTLFLYGIIVGAVAMLGLGLLLTGARRTSRRATEARHGLRHSRRETAAARKRRDDVVEQRDDARAEAASVADDRDSLAQERDALAAQRDDLARQRNDLAGQRDDAITRQSEASREQTAGTRATPMAPAESSTPQAEDEPAPDTGHRRPHLLGHRSGLQ
ncbi:hypothetical protein OG500_01935 [Kitasatospora sp. NBC_01250]|uniref:hypothetical protein n=1 Tax=unclassified Kitasatospora TaxID=2633591 RepID=UPI002E14C46B|nr:MULTISPECIES: hypothetical protein [unclassified Kitasatospora]WSJ64947.1 hypothetical protein OG294_01865 [Kitasatospora sp. NBC_01302]